MVHFNAILATYSQNIPHKYSMPNPAAPPVLPPQLLQVILNTETPLQQVAVCCHYFILCLKNGHTFFKITF